MVDNALKRLAKIRKPGQWLVSALESVEETNGPGRVDPGWFHPSDLGHPCDAFLAFKFLGAPSVESVSARLRRIYDNGSARDEQLKHDCKRAGISLIKKPQDRTISLPDVRIRGELDDWVINPVTQRKYVVDFKTMNTNEFEELTVAKPGHIIQVHSYMVAKETYEGIVLYENKNTQELKPMPADFNQNLWQTRIVDRVHHVLEGIRKGFVTRTPIPNESKCPFYNICSIANFDQLREKSGIDV